MNASLTLKMHRDLVGSISELGKLSGDHQWISWCIHRTRCSNPAPSLPKPADPLSSILETDIQKVQGSFSWFTFTFSFLFVPKQLFLIRNSVGKEEFLMNSLILKPTGYLSEMKLVREANRAILQKSYDLAKEKHFWDYKHGDNLTNTWVNGSFNTKPNRGFFACIFKNRA